MNPDAARTAEGLLQNIYAAGLHLDAVLAHIGDDESPAISLRIALGALDVLADDVQKEALRQQSSVGVGTD